MRETVTIAIVAALIVAALGLLFMWRIGLI